MKPEDVPAELVDMLADPLNDDAHENCEETGCPGNVRPYFEDLARWVLADLIPEIARQEREKVIGEARNAAQWLNANGHRHDADALRWFVGQWLRTAPTPT